MSSSIKNQSPNKKRSRVPNLYLLKMIILSIKDKLSKVIELGISRTWFQLIKSEILISRKKKIILSSYSRFKDLIPL
jgi:hypothetical protein